MDTPNKQQYIAQLLQSDSPFFIGRIAGVELQTAYNFVNDNLNQVERNLLELSNNAGIYVTSNESLLTYVDKLIASYMHCTVIAEWDETGPVFAITGKGQRFIQIRTPTIPKINARELEPYYYKESWMSAMKGKRVLIIHPFIHTMQNQLHHLSVLFTGRNWFEDCTITFFKPPVTLAGHHMKRDWREHYETSILSLIHI